MRSHSGFLSILLDTFRAYLLAPVTFILVAAPAVLSLGAIMIGADLAVGLAERVAHLSAEASGPTQVPMSEFYSVGAAAAAYLGICALAGVFVGPLGVGALIAASSELTRGYRPSVIDCYVAAYERWPQLILSCLVLVLGPLAVSVGFTAFAVLSGVRFVLLPQFLNILILRFALAPSAIIVDGDGFVDSLRRAWRVTGGHYMALAGLTIIFAGVVLGPALIAAGGPAGIGDLEVTFRLGEATGAIAAAVLSPLPAIMLTLAYQRWKAEQAAL